MYIINFVIQFYNKPTAVSVKYNCILVRSRQLCVTVFWQSVVSLYKYTTILAMYMYRNMVARSSSPYYYGNSTMRSVCTVDLHLAFSSIKALSVAMETQECVSCALLSYKIFRIAVHSFHVLRLLCKVYYIFVGF